MLFINPNKIIILSFFICLPHLLHSQAGAVQRDPITHDITNIQDAVVPKGVPSYNIANPGLRQNNDSLSYENVNGSPFWRDAPLPALLYSGDKYITSMPIRINLATNEIYFTKDAEEKVLTENFINKIIIKSSGDTAVFISQVPNLLLSKKPVVGFVQVLNAGKYQLLKYVKRRAVSAIPTSNASLSFHFTDDTYYFIMSGEKVEAIRKLNRENLLSHLPSSSLFDEWIKEHAVNFKNEKDALVFLTYYNSRPVN